MEYEFRHDTITGNATANFSYEHQGMGPWLEVEIGRNSQKLARVLSAIQQIISREEQEIAITGQEYSVTISLSDVVVNANASLNEMNSVPEQLTSDELNFDENCTASCGIDDFRELLLSWADFIKK